MKELIIYYWHLCLFKELPENTPYSKFLMSISGLLLTLILIIQWRFSDFDISNDLLKVILVATSLSLSYVGYTYIILYLKRLHSRTVQTLTCLFSSHLIIHLIAAPLVFTALYLDQVNLKNPLLLVIGMIYLLITLGLSVWQFLVTVHIYKHALNSSSEQAIITAFGLIAVNILTISFGR